MATRRWRHHVLATQLSQVLAQAIEELQSSADNANCFGRDGVPLGADRKTQAKSLGLLLWSPTGQSLLNCKMSLQANQAQELLTIPIRQPYSQFQRKALRAKDFQQSGSREELLPRHLPLRLLSAE